MSEVFTNTLQQTLLLFIFLLIGALLKIFHVLPDNSARVISRLEVYVISPALSFKTFAARFNVETMHEAGTLMITGLIVLAAVGVISLLISRFFSRDPYQRDIYTYSFIISNYGYIGYALMSALYGEEMLYEMMLFALLISVFTNSVGFYLLSPQHKWDLKTIFNPPFVGILAGMVVGFFKIPLPEFISSAAASASDCMAPLAMILAGFVIASRSIPALLKDWKAYIACAIRLLGLPLAGLAISRLLNLPANITTVIVVFLAMPMGLNSVVFPESQGGDSTTGAKLALISNVAGMITIPLVLALI